MLCMIIPFEKQKTCFGFFFPDKFFSSVLFFLFTIAAGKSTFVNILKQVCQDWEVVPEPIARWCNVQNTQDEFQVWKLNLSKIKISWLREAIIFNLLGVCLLFFFPIKLWNLAWSLYVHLGNSIRIFIYVNIGLYASKIYVLDYI